MAIPIGACYGCDGCGKIVRCDTLENPDKPPPGWLYSTDERYVYADRWDAGPWSAGFVACSADCVTAAKDERKRRATEAVERYKRRIDNVVLVRSK